MFLAPLFGMYADGNLYDTRLGLMLVYVAWAVPFAFFLIRNQMTTMPPEVTEAAMLDGATFRRIFWRIHVPLMGSSLAAAFIFQFTAVWNDLLFGITLSRSPDIQPVMAALTTLNNAYASSGPPVILAGALIVSLPTLVVFLVFRGLSCAASPRPHVSPAPQHDLERSHDHTGTRPYDRLGQRPDTRQPSRLGRERRRQSGAAPCVSPSNHCCATPENGGLLQSLRVEAVNGSRLPDELTVRTESGSALPAERIAGPNGSVRLLLPAVDTAQRSRWACTGTRTAESTSVSPPNATGPSTSSTTRTWTSATPTLKAGCWPSTCPSSTPASS